jgi:hypothetical protein
MLKDFLSTFKSFTPIVLGLLVIQVLVLKKPLDKPQEFFGGYILGLLGLFLFLRGIAMCLLPLGHNVGQNLPVLDNKFWIILIAFAIGYLSTLAEPALQSLALEAEEVSVGALPQKVLIQAVAIGFGAGMALGVAKILYQIPTSAVIIPFLFITVILAYFSPETFVGIAFDSASATTGPINIPINMAIAVGLSTVLATVDPLAAGFGLVGLTSLGAASSVMILGILTRF